MDIQGHWVWALGPGLHWRYPRLSGLSGIVPGDAINSSYSQPLSKSKLAGYRGKHSHWLKLIQWLQPLCEAFVWKQQHQGKVEPRLWLGILKFTGLPSDKGIFMAQQNHCLVITLTQSVSFWLPDFLWPKVQVYPPWKDRTTTWI
jgi:hypothetical protein